MNKFSLSSQSVSQQNETRKGAILVLSAFVIIIVFAFVSFTIDLGYMTVMKTGLQSTADSAALGAVLELGNGQAQARQMAKDLAAANIVGGSGVTLQDSDIEIGIFDESTKTFTVATKGANAVRVIAKKYDYPTFFGPVIGQQKMSSRTEAIAMMSPRDIVFCVDLSGSMNDDTEPCWATVTLDKMLAPDGYPTAGTNLANDLFSDLGYGSYPGTYEYLGAPLGVRSDKYAYAEMTKDNGPLTASSIPSKYRIKNSDSEKTRKMKAYKWIIDKQIAVKMPKAKPTPNSSSNYNYWSKYIDYIMYRTYVGKKKKKPPKGGGGGGSSGGGGGGGGPKPPKPPKPPVGQYKPFHFLNGNGQRSVVGSSIENGIRWWSNFSQMQPSHLFTMQAAAPAGVGVPRNGSEKKVYLPPSQDGDRIYKFNNPNRYTFPKAKSSLSRNWRNKIGYITYVQFMLDWGRDRSPEQSNSKNANEALPGKVPISVLSPYCPYHSEATAGGTFNFPPRTQPMHAVRRSLIAAIQVVKEMNSGLAVGSGDRVSIVTYDGYDKYHKPKLVLPLTGDFDAAMQACTTLQATSDIGTTTAMETGIVLARDHIKPVSQGGQGREFTSKVVVLLTDGVPNAYQSTNAEIDQYMADHPSDEYYGGGYYWLDSVLMQSDQFAGDDDGNLYPVGMGLGTDYDFMDRLARMSLTDKNGKSPRGSGNPTDYEQRLTEIFEEIIRRPDSRLVQ